MRIMISNDDGFEAQGLRVLKDHLSKIAEVIVVAPDKQRSATGHSVTLKKPIIIDEVEKNFYTVSGTPTDAVKLGLLEIFKDNKPDLIVSGINHGGNIGEDITYSGTVACAIEGVLNGVPSIAVSLVIKSFFTKPDEVIVETLHFETAGAFIEKFIKNLNPGEIPPLTFFNINVPNVPSDKIKGVCSTSLGKRCYGEQVSVLTDPYGNNMYWFTGNDFTLFDEDGADSQAILHNKISITPLNLDFTDYKFLEKMKSDWKIEL